MSKKVRNIILICISIIAISSLALVFTPFSYTKDDIKYYKDLTKNNKILPKLDNLGNYIDIKFKYYHKDVIIFESDAYTLTVKYDENNFNNEVAKINNNYHFQNNTVKDINNEFNPNFTIDDYEFKLLSLDEYDLLSFPKEIYLIGFDNKNHEIIYIYFYDNDLDYITSFKDFLYEYCDWQ